MNPTIDLLLNRKSCRAYRSTAIGEEETETILHAAMRAPTAGNLMLYSILRIMDQRSKETLAETCDHQPFIAKAPLVLLFLADYQRWFDCFQCKLDEERMQGPKEADLFLACCDALIAAQTAVIAAESMGIGSCYIGDIMENYEIHRQLFDLPPYAFPICLLCFGYPARGQSNTSLSTRYSRKFIVFEEKYRRFSGDDFDEMLALGPEASGGPVAREVYSRKFNADFTKEMRRSVKAMLRHWVEG